MTQQLPEESTALTPLVPAPRESASTFYSDTENSFPLLQVEISQKRAYDWFSKSPLGVNSPARQKVWPGSLQAGSLHDDGCLWVGLPS